MLERGIPYRHEKVLLRQGRLHAQTQVNNVYVLDCYSFISLDQCVRLGSDFFCEIRISCRAAVDCNGVIKKINMRKIRSGQGLGS